MSKMDGLRAMREAKYAAAAKRTAAPARPRVAPAPADERPPAAATTPTSAPPASGEPARCGHRNMGGRTCTREQGHAAKSHRYS